MRILYYIYESLKNRGTRRFNIQMLINRKLFVLALSSIPLYHIWELTYLYELI